MNRQLRAASTILESLASEEHKRQVLNASRFPAFGYRVGDGAHIRRSVPGPPSLHQHIPPQRYPGVNGATHVVVPFLLFGSVNIKTGEAVLTKVHFEHVYNYITYRGHMQVIGLNHNDVALHVGQNTLAQCLDQDMEFLVKELHFNLSAEWSSANLVFTSPSKASAVLSTATVPFDVESVPPRNIFSIACQPRTLNNNVQSPTNQPILWCWSDKRVAALEFLSMIMIPVIHVQALQKLTNSPTTPITTSTTHARDFVSNNLWTYAIWCVLLPGASWIFPCPSSQRQIVAEAQ